MGRGAVQRVEGGVVSAPGSPSSERRFLVAEKSLASSREQIEPLHCNREWQSLDCELQLSRPNGKFGLPRPRLLRREKQCSHADAPQFPALPCGRMSFRSPAVSDLSAIDVAGIWGGVERWV